MKKILQDILDSFPVQFIALVIFMVVPLVLVISHDMKQREVTYDIRREECQALPQFEILSTIPIASVSRDVSGRWGTGVTFLLSIGYIEDIQSYFFYRIDPNDTYRLDHISASTPIKEENSTPRIETQLSRYWEEVYGNCEESVNTIIIVPKNTIIKNFQL